MPAFSLDPAQTAWCEELRALAAERLRPLAEKGEPGPVNRPLRRRTRRTGPAGAGCSRSGALDLCLLRESLAHGCTEAETALALQGLGTYPVVQAGTAAQRERWLPEVRAGRAVAAFALSEPGAGSDAAALALEPSRDGRGRLAADRREVLDLQRPRGRLLHRLRPYDPGRRSPRRHRLPGPRRPPGADRHSPGHALPAPHRHPRLRRRAGRPPTTCSANPDRGFRVAMNTLNLFRPSVGAFAVGMAQAALDATLAHTAQPHRVRRPAQGSPGRLPPGRRDGHPHRGRPAPGVRGGRGVRRGEPRTCRGARPWRSCCATETAQYVVDAAVQLHGARALRRGHLLEHLYREVRAPRIYEGASEVQRTIIAKELYAERRRSRPHEPATADQPAPNCPRPPASRTPSRPPASDWSSWPGRPRWTRTARSSATPCPNSSRRPSPICSPHCARPAAPRPIWPGSPSTPPMSPTTAPTPPNSAGIWRRLAGRDYPAMAVIGVARLWDEEALVELDGMAVLP